MADIPWSTRMQAGFDREWTAGDVLAAQQTSLFRVELLDGIPLMSPLPTLRHQHVSGVLADILRRAVDDSGVGAVPFKSVNVRRGHRDVLRPDIAVVTSTAAIGALESDAVAFAPEDVLLAAEILSPGHEGADRIDKPARYAEWNIPSYWIVDPKTLSIDTYTLDGDVYVASGSAAPGAVATLPALTPITLDPGTLLRLW
ncbi:Uma2 family endonuclease [Embleya sp. NPDC059237]|uniref:Uma2 family endonuclease n=1 Tax=Embleya sp. NPDC059237 TaxID=3346784 RepID=UPI0036A463B0